MRALVLHETTGPDGLRLEDFPAPDAPDGTVAIEVHAAGIGFASGEIPRLEVNRLLLRSTDVVGVNYGGTLAFDQAFAQAAWGDLRRWWTDGLLPVAGITEHALEEVPDVLRALGERRMPGKPVALLR